MEIRSQKEWSQAAAKRESKVESVRVRDGRVRSVGDPGVYETQRVAAQGDYSKIGLSIQTHDGGTRAPIANLDSLNCTPESGNPLDNGRAHADIHAHLLLVLC